MCSACRETRLTLYLFCLAGNTLLTAGVGAALIVFSRRAIRAGRAAWRIGMGIVAYAVAVMPLHPAFRLAERAVRTCSVS